jgi:hypothetical protein
LASGFLALAHYSPYGGWPGEALRAGATVEGSKHAEGQTLAETPPTYEGCAEEIMRIRQELNEAQMSVIQGKLKPADYKQLEVERVGRIHELEEAIAKMQGMA